MNKTKLFLDYDGCIIDSIKAYCSVYNELYQFRPNFKRADWSEVEIWDLKDQCPLVLNCNDIFSNYLFFQKCDFICRNTKEVIEKLCEKYEVFICSIGTPENIAFKSMWLNEHLPCVKNYIMLVNDGCKMTKAIVDMKDSIFIDDVTSNLDSSNAKLKIIFGNEYYWSQTKDYTRCFNWTDVEKLLL